jgi:hypothetical protein
MAVALGVFADADGAQFPLRVMSEGSGFFVGQTLTGTLGKLRRMFSVLAVALVIEVGKRTDPR